MHTKLTFTVPRKDELCITRGEESALVKDIVKSLESIEVEERFKKTRDSLGYKAAYCRETFSDELWQAMDNRGLSQSAFAEKADVSKQFLTKVFRGGNCTIDTMVKLAFGLNYTLHIHLTPNEMGCAWLHRIDEVAQRHPKQSCDLWNVAGYKRMAIMENEIDCEKVTS